MTAWESEYPDELEPTDVEADNHFFGFAGQAKMSGLFVHSDLPMYGC